MAALHVVAPADFGRLGLADGRAHRLRGFDLGLLGLKRPRRAVALDRGNSPARDPQVGAVPLGLEVGADVVDERLSRQTLLAGQLLEQFVFARTSPLCGEVFDRVLTVKNGQSSR